MPTDYCKFEWFHWVLIYSYPTLRFFSLRRRKNSKWPHSWTPSYVTRNWNFCLRRRKKCIIRFREQSTASLQVKQVNLRGSCWAKTAFLFTSVRMLLKRNMNGRHNKLRSPPVSVATAAENPQTDGHKRWTFAMRNKYTLNATRTATDTLKKN